MIACEELTLTWVLVYDLENHPATRSSWCVRVRVHFRRRADICQRSRYSVLLCYVLLLARYSRVRHDLEGRLATP